MGNPWTRRAVPGLVLGADGLSTAGARVDLVPWKAWGWEVRREGAKQAKNPGKNDGAVHRQGMKSLLLVARRVFGMSRCLCYTQP